MEWDGFHAKAKAAMPVEGIPPKKYMVGVLLPGKSPEQDLDEFDFQWMRGHAKITIQKVRDSYMGKHLDVEVDLLFEGSSQPLDTILSSLNRKGDNFIVLRAVERRTPLTVNANIPQPAPTLPQEPVLRSPPNLRSPQHSLPLLSTQAQFYARPDASRTNLPIAISATEDVYTPARSALHDQGQTQQSSAWTPTYNFFASTLRKSTSPSTDPPQSTQAPSAGSEPVGVHLVQPEPYRSPYPTFPVHPSPFAQSIDPPQPTLVKAERSSPMPFRNHAQESAYPADPFNAEDIFDRDPSQPDNEVAVESFDRSINAIIDQRSVGMLESGVAKSMKALEVLKTTFSRFAISNPESATWIGSIDKLQGQAERTRTVVGVVGNTGAGKSSVINAILDEERLVPTNCMRACTAVATELSWNDSKLPNSKYRAEIEFISPAAWEKELRILMTEFMTESGTLTREVSDQNSDAGIAWAKFHAVYPKVHKDTLGQCSVEKLMAEASVLSVLGTTKRINQAWPDRFYTELQKYVDSKEKATGKKGKDGQKETQKRLPAQQEYWPLIKVVKIYTKAAALSTGAIVVDLPGVHDSNAARAAVAEQHMKQCTGLWIVAPITRAVDDKAAKNLLGESFRRQLKYDGNYSSVTFICSKTDDISITEATDTLELGEEISTLENQQRKFEEEIETIKNEIGELKESVEVYKDIMDEADNDIETWEDLKDSSEQGESVFAPASKSNKRKKSASSKNSRKRHKIDEDDSDVEYISSDTEDDNDTKDDSDVEGTEPSRELLTHDKIKRKLEELRSTKKNARQEKAVVTKQISELRPKIGELKRCIAEVRAAMSAICIAGRNENSKGAIQQDFAAGIKELDQENQIEEDEENFNPDEDIRDYDEVAKSLPVFCVSSRAYQKMSGRLKKDEDVPGFKTVEETEVPQLQEHCKKLTEAGRIQNCRTFLLNLRQQLTTFSIWASNDGTGLEMTDDDKQKQLAYLQKRLAELDKGLEQAVAACLKVMKKELHDQIFDRYPELVNEAVQAAPATAYKWGYKDQGGLHYMTYKAVVRRGGQYQSPTAGLRNFNADLMNPILRKLATGWERAFQNRLPKAFEVYTKNSGTVLLKFHQMIEERAHSNGVGLASLALLRSSIDTYERMFQEFGAELLAAMIELQKDANREFIPPIAAAMATAYHLCADERGGGSYMRMKGHMTGHVEQERHAMFARATQTVEGHLNQMCRSLEEKMANKADEIFASMRADYMNVLGGVQISHGAMTREERTMRSEVRGHLKDLNTEFERLANGDLKDEQEGVNLENGGADAEVDVPLQFEDDAGSVAASPQDQDDVTMHDAGDDTVITEPSPTRPSDVVGAGPSPRKQKLVYVSDGMDEEL